jgi:hypothetical protein
MTVLPIVAEEQEMPPPLPPFPPITPLLPPRPVPVLFFEIAESVIIGQESLEAQMPPPSPPFPAVSKELFVPAKVLLPVMMQLVITGFAFVQ